MSKSSNQPEQQSTPLRPGAVDMVIAAIIQDYLGDLKRKRRQEIVRGWVERADLLDRAGRYRAGVYPIRGGGQAYGSRAQDEDAVAAAAMFQACARLAVRAYNLGEETLL